MMPDPVDLEEAMGVLATAVLGADRPVAGRLGSIVLHPHQVEAAGRSLRLLERHRGALLADGVGLGKTYVALSVATAYRRPMVVCPAALLAMWQTAMAAAGITMPVVSTESLSRKDPASFDADLVIVDEAHHFRNSTSRRYGRLASLTRDARVLLISATPLQNRRRDLTTVLAIFAGSPVSAWPAERLARLIVRRESASGQTLPRVDGPHRITLSRHDDLLDALTALPSPVPAADEGTAAALVGISLIHLWASSRAALLASLQRRRARALALRDAVESGRLPTRAELAAWFFTEDALQLAFTLCVSDDAVPAPVELRDRLDRYIGDVGDLIARCRADAGVDEERATMIMRIRIRHPARRIVAFSQYAHTVQAMGRLLRGERGVAVVTGSDARIASGRLPRSEVLRQFAGDSAEPDPVEAVSLLLCTDILSEGIDLRKASVVVHLDHPWNPARLEQRVGRARRLGSPFDEIHVYRFMPPANAERVLAVEQRLRSKIRTAEALVGRSPGLFLIDGVGSAPGPSAVGQQESLSDAFRRWLGQGAIPTRPVVSAATAAEGEWIAAVMIRRSIRLICCVDGGVDDAPAIVARIAGGVGSSVRVGEIRARRALEMIADWLRRAHVAEDLAVGSSRVRRTILARVDAAAVNGPRHRRSGLLIDAERTRDALARGGAGVEQALLSAGGAVEQARLPGEDGVEHLLVPTAAGRAGVHRDHQRRGTGEEDGLVALVILERPTSAAATPG